MGAAAALVSCGGLTGPSCRDESGQVFHVNGVVVSGTTVSYSVTSPTSSNLIIRLTWPEAAATLDLRATITDCGGHAGCLMATFTPASGPGGSSSVPQSWPAGVREMLVDGWTGKTYRIDVTGNPDREAGFTLNVTYRISCER